MIKNTHIIIICVLLFAVLPLAVVAGAKSEVKMKGITFVPEMFNSFDVNQYDISTENACTERLETAETDTIQLYAPKEIIFDASAPGFAPAIPVCGNYMLSHGWHLKYHYLPEDMLYIRRVGEDKWHSGKIDRELRLYKKFGVHQHPAPRPNQEAEEKLLERLRKEAQNVTDELLKYLSGGASGRNFTENLLDYVDIPLSSGVYEIYMSCYNIKSNKVKVKITFKDKKSK